MVSEEKEEFNLIEEEKLNKNIINFSNFIQNNFNYQNEEKLIKFSYQCYKFAENLKIKYESHQKLFQFLKKYYDIKLSLSSLGFYVDCYTNDTIEYIIIFDKTRNEQKKVILHEKSKKMIFTAEKMFKGSLIGNGEVYLCKDNDDIIFHKKGEYFSVSFPIIKDSYGKTLFNVNYDYSYSSINPIFPTTFLKDENEK